MNPQTEKFLGTLEVITHKNTFFWETEKQGEFNLWNLMLWQGFVKETDLDLAFEHWQNIEIWGTPTSNDYEYAPKREERQDDDWNASISEQRQKYYQELKKICEEELQDLKAYTLQNHDSRYRKYQPQFYVSIIVGRIDKNWITLAPIVQDLCFYRKNNNQYLIDYYDSELSQINFILIDAILNKLTPITLYDYYYGGYNQTHQHQIVRGLGTTKEQSIAKALRKSKMVIWQSDQIDDTEKNAEKYNKFMNQCLQNRTCCQISLWDVGYSYEFGKTPTNDWIGTKCFAEFEYNP